MSRKTIANLLRTFPIAALIACASVSAPTIAASFVVNNTGDAGDANPGDGVCATAGNVCTLRAAIEEANALAGADSIGFNLSGSGVITITKTSAFPDITGVVHINGYSQTGATANTLAVGSNATLRVRFDQPGTPSLNSAGFTFVPGSDGSSIRGLIMSGHNHAVLLRGVSNVTVAGNFIGTDATGANLANAFGVFMLAAGNTGASNNIVGGANPADRNVIANNHSTGVSIGSSPSTGNTVRNNYIGTAPDGIAVRQNATYGVFINSAAATVVRDNVITTNDVSILVSNGGANQTSIVGNVIGVGANGTAITGGGRGIVVSSGNSGAPQMTSIGGIGAGQGNVIANQSGIAVQVDRGAVAHSYPSNTIIRGNSIYNNGGLGIDLADSATATGVGTVNANDSNDADAGANDFQNYPVVTAATTDGATTTISFTYNSAALGNYVVDAYSSTVCDASGHGEGRTYLGTINVNTDAAGNGGATMASLPATIVGHVITLTAMDALYQGTSEFSACRAVTAAAPTLAAQVQPVPVWGAWGGAIAALLMAGVVARTARFHRTKRG